MKEQIKSSINLSIDQNFEKWNKYLNDDLYYFVSLKSICFEIIKCLIFELDQTAISSTNHLLERFVKLSLINHHTINYNYSNVEMYNEKTLEAIELYDRQKLYNNLKSIKEQNLITNEEYALLDNYRDKIRNPYSHAELKKILENAPNKFTGYMFKLSDLNDVLSGKKTMYQGGKKEITTYSSAISQLYQENYSKKIASDYFKNVFTIMKNVDDRLKKLEK